MVSGSELYNVKITIAPLGKNKWAAGQARLFRKNCILDRSVAGEAGSGVMEVVSDRKEGLFPLPGEMKFDCDCPDWAGMCKHVAAVLYGVGARLDLAPEMLFVLRGVNHEELVDVSAAVADTTRKAPPDGGLPRLVSPMFSVSIWPMPMRKISNRRKVPAHKSKSKKTSKTAADRSRTQAKAKKSPVKKRRKKERV